MKKTTAQIRSVLILLVIVGFLFVPSRSIAQEAAPLPNDLIVPVERLDPETDERLYILARVDANTLEVTEWYIDELRTFPESWSPNGKWLAITRYEDNYNIYICILSRDGINQGCVDDQPVTMWTWGDGDFLPLNITWSNDGQYIYFVTEDTGYLKLVEVNRESGKTERTVYEYPVSDEYPLSMSWTSDLTYVVVASTYSNKPMLLVDLTTGEEIELFADSTTETLSTGSHCFGFSPQDSYFVVFRNGLNILDRQGNIVATTNSGTCPIWQSNEEAIYLFGNRDLVYAIYKYSLVTDEREVYQDIYYITPGLGPV